MTGERKPNSKSVKISFLQYNRPPIFEGDYIITVKQLISTKPSGSLPVTDNRVQLDAKETLMRSATRIVEVKL